MRAAIVSKFYNIRLFIKGNNLFSTVILAADGHEFKKL